MHLFDSKKGILRPKNGLVFKLMLIAVVINMFRLPDFLTGENVMCIGLKL
jgi:hypothetical protein